MSLEEARNDPIKYLNEYFKVPKDRRHKVKDMNFIMRKYENKDHAHVMMNSLAG